MFMIMFVLDDAQLLDKVLESWAKIDISGATIIESSGFHHRMKKIIPMRYVYRNDDVEEIGNLTIFLIVKTEKKVKECLTAIEGIVGDLDKPNTGIFSAWPLQMVKGIPSQEQEDV